MYNRYIRNDHGSYTRIPQEEAPPSGFNSKEAPPETPYNQQEESRSDDSVHNEEPCRDEGFNGLLRRLLDHLHLDHIDTGDLLLLVLLFFLFREDADEELLIALGLLLIL